MSVSGVNTMFVDVTDELSQGFIRELWYISIHTYIHKYIQIHLCLVGVCRTLLAPAEESITFSSVNNGDKSSLKGTRGCIHTYIHTFIHSCHVLELADDQGTSMPLADILNHPRWDNCGLSSAANVPLVCMYVCIYVCIYVCMTCRWKSVVYMS